MVILDAISISIPEGKAPRELYTRFRRHLEGHWGFRPFGIITYQEWETLPPDFMLPAEEANVHENRRTKKVTWAEGFSKASDDVPNVKTRSQDCIDELTRCLRDIRL